MIIVGVSGGPDSMALVEMLRKKDPNLSFGSHKDESLLLCHVNYRHRPTANRDEKIVRDYAKRHHLPLCVLQADPDLCVGNFQAWARDVRYEFFARMARKHGAKTLAIAHQQDDLIETWLLQRQRNIIPECWGLPETSGRKDLLVWRPLLGRSKKELAKWCLDHKIPFGIDESNLKDEYARNRIRHETVESMNERERERALQEIRHQNDLLKEKRKKARELLKDDAFLTGEDPELRSLALSNLLFFKTGIRFSGRQIYEALRQLDQSGRFEFVLPAKKEEPKKKFRFQSVQTGMQNVPEVSVHDVEEYVLKVAEGSKNEDSPGKEIQRPPRLAGILKPDRPGGGKRLHLRLEAGRKKPENREAEHHKAELLKAENRENREKGKSASWPFCVESRKQLEELCQSKTRMNLSEDWAIEWTDHPKRIESFCVSDDDFPILLDFVKTGDEIEMRFGTKKASRILIDKKIERSARKTFPLIRNNRQKVIFIPYTGCDVSHFKENSSSGMVLFSLTNSEQNQTDIDRNEK